MTYQPDPCTRTGVHTCKNPGSHRRPPAEEPASTATDWAQTARDLISDDPERVARHLPQWARIVSGEWECQQCGYHNNGGICTHCGHVPRTPSEVFTARKCGCKMDTPDPSCTTHNKPAKAHPCFLVDCPPAPDGGYNINVTGGGVGDLDEAAILLLLAVEAITGVRTDGYVRLVDGVRRFAARDGGELPAAGRLLSDAAARVAAAVAPKPAPTAEDAP